MTRRAFLSTFIVLSAQTLFVGLPVSASIHLPIKVTLMTDVAFVGEALRSRVREVL